MWLKIHVDDLISCHVVRVVANYYKLICNQTLSFNVSLFLNVSDGQWLVGIVVEDELVHKACNPTSNQRPSPVNPVVGPVPADQSWPKRYSRVHGCPVKSSTRQNVGTNYETNCNWCNNPNIFYASFIQGSSINSVNQAKCHHDL